MPVLGFIGGTGPEGRGLALRMALAGHTVVIGSRRTERGQEAAQKVLDLAPGADVHGGDNAEAVAKGDIVFITVPFEGQRSILEQLRDGLKGKVVVNTVVPLEFVDGTPRANIVAEGSAAEQSQAILPGSPVVAAFQNLSAHDLLRPQQIVNGDVIVCSDHAEPKKQIMALAEQIPGVRAVDGGGLANSRYVEDFTALLLNINRIYKGHSMFRITGVPGLRPTPDS